MPNIVNFIGLNGKSTELGFNLIGELIIKLYPLVNPGNPKANEGCRIEVSDAIPDSRLVEMKNNLKAFGLDEGIVKVDSLEWEGKGGGGSMKTLKSFIAKGGNPDSEEDFNEYKDKLEQMEALGNRIVEICPFVHKSIAFPFNSKEAIEKVKKERGF